MLAGATKLVTGRAALRGNVGDQTRQQADRLQQKAGLRASVVTMLLFVSHAFGDFHSTFDVGFLSDRLGSLQLALLLVSTPLLLVAADLAYRNAKEKGLGTEVQI